MSKHKILIPLDGSVLSQQILPKVRDLFNPANVELILLRVAPPPQGLVGVPTYASQRDVELANHPIYANKVWDSQVAMLENELRPELLELQQAGYTASTAIRFGEPAQEILNLVSEEKVDLVAMTSYDLIGLIM